MNLQKTIEAIKDGRGEGYDWAEVFEYYNAEKVLELIKIVDEQEDDFEYWHLLKDELIASLAVEFIKKDSHQSRTASYIEANEKLIEWIKDNQTNGWYA